MTLSKRAALPIYSPLSRTDSESRERSGLVQSRRLLLQLRGPWVAGQWAGPALRGLIAAPVKRHFCAWDAAIRDQLYQHCDGCPHQRDCEYARWFEPGKKSEAVAGWGRDIHQICIVPEFVSSRRHAKGDCDTLSVDLLALSGSDDAERLIGQIRAVGKRDRPGRKGLSFEVIEELSAGTNALFDFWDSWDAIESVPMDAVATGVAFHAVTPLLLKRDGQAQLRPTLFDIAAASLRLLRQIMAQWPRESGIASPSTPLSVADAEAWKHIAANCNETTKWWQKVVTNHHSFRSQQSYAIVACHGFCQYENVPLRLVRMIELAGQLGIGQKRVCGAGRIAVKPM